MLLDPSDLTTIEENADSETLYVFGATVGKLAVFLNPEIPWVWILDHSPNNRVAWENHELPVNHEGYRIRASYRMVFYDMVLPTRQFLESVHAFENCGIRLVQSRKQMPNTLILDHIPVNKQNQVLMMNGAFLKIYLPHAVETAQVSCFEKGYLGTVVDALY